MAKRIVTEVNCIMLGDYYILEHRVVRKAKDLEEFAKFNGSEHRQIALTQVGEAEVSTVFLGIDHNYGGAWPILFETMIFGGAHRGDYQRRYSTIEEAEAGHAEAVELLETTPIIRGAT